MARYHLYYLRRGMLVGSDVVEAVDETEAARLASTRSDGRTVEIWDAARRLRVIPADTIGRAAAATRS